jgi:hypothetical protein
MTMVTEPTSGQDARADRKAAEERLAQAVASRPEVRRITESMERMLQENHFSVRLARALGLEDDRR